MAEEFWLFVKQLPNREMDGPFDTFVEAMNFVQSSGIELLGDVQLVRLHDDGQQVVASTDPLDLDDD